MAAGRLRGGEELTQMTGRYARFFCLRGRIVPSQTCVTRIDTREDVCNLKIMRTLKIKGFREKHTIGLGEKQRVFREKRENMDTRE